MTTTRPSYVSTPNGSTSCSSDVGSTFVGTAEGYTWAGPYTLWAWGFALPLGHVRSIRPTPHPPHFGQPSLVDLALALSEIPPSYNLVPTQRASVILDRGTGRQVSRLALCLLPAERQDALGVTDAMMKAYAKSVPRVRPTGPTDKC